MKSNNTIEINGKLYDAKTGAPLHSSAPTQRTVAPVVKRRSNGTSIDGFSRRKSIPVSTGVKPAAKSPQKAVTPKTKSPATRSAAHTVKRAPRKSLTLNRSGVQSPKKHTATPASSTGKKQNSALSSSAFKHADTQRVERAQHVSKSPIITRFKTVSKQPTPPQKSQTGPLAEHLTKTHSTPDTKLSTKERLIQQAVASAVSTAPTHAKKHKATGRRNHFSKYASSAAVALVLAGYVAYLNVPSISMKVAAHRAGFAAAMPSYRPAGYSLRGPIAYSPGQVTVNFKSNTDDRKFSLKQQPTTWDSTALLENYVTKQNPSYLTYQDKGLTIYIYDGSSAAWVNGGTLYNLEGKDSKLDTDQLLKLATSV